jgi:hypothetical protein
MFFLDKWNVLNQVDMKITCHLQWRNVKSSYDINMYPTNLFKKQEEGKRVRMLCSRRKQHQQLP